MISRGNLLERSKRSGEEALVTNDPVEEDAGLKENLDSRAEKSEEDKEKIEVEDIEEEKKVVGGLSKIEDIPSRGSADADVFEKDGSQEFTSVEIPALINIDDITDIIVFDNIYTK